MHATSANSRVIMKTGKECQHCGAQETPQWREGPLGPKTLCNACGMRYRSGRLVPEYRPAKSPTFSIDLHSNSHKQVLQMRSVRQPMWMFGVEPDNKGSVEIGIVKCQGAGSTIKKKPECQGADAAAQKEPKSQGADATTQKKPKFQGAHAIVQSELESQGADATAQNEPQSQVADTTARKEPESQCVDATVQKEPESLAADATAQKEPKSQCADATMQKEPKSQCADATAQKEPKSQCADATMQKEPKSQAANARKKREPKSQDAITTESIVKKEYRHRRAKETPKWWQRTDASTSLNTMRKECRNPKTKETPQLQERQDSSTTFKAMKKECQHCRTNETPQWREGPLGPNTLCNACGLRYRSGRLFPEYRPAKSPTFSSELHSNSDKQIFQRRSTNQPMEMIGLEPDDKGKFVESSTRKSQDADAIVNKKAKYQDVDFTVVKEETSVEGNLHPLSYEGFRLRDFCMKLNQLRETEGRSESLFWEKKGKLNI